jgi:hypothetical protein
MSRVRIIEVPVAAPVIDETPEALKPRHRREHVRVSSDRIVVRCVFHVEKSPSLFLYPNGHYRCYGCGKHGSDWRENSVLVAKALRLRGEELQMQMAFLAPLPTVPPPSEEVESESDLACHTSNREP